MNINKLLDKYLRGETSCREEERLRRFFMQEQVPAELEEYRPLFAYIERERKQEGAKKRSPLLLHHKRQILWYAAAGMAASLMLYVGITHWVATAEPRDNYVMIDGTCYTDPGLTRSHALEALSQMRCDDGDGMEALFGDQE